MAETRVPWLLFAIGDAGYAIPLGAVVEVTRAARPRLIPQVPLAVGGIVNLRGEPLPAVDGAVLLAAAAPRTPRHAIVLEQTGARVGVLVEQVSRIDWGFRPGAPYQGSEPRTESELVRWVHSERAVVGVVDPSALFDRASALLTGKAPGEGGGRSCTAF